MKGLAIFSVVFVLVAIVGAAHSIEATDDNFVALVQEHPVALVEFYAPWCGHCKHLEPEWEKASHELEGKVAMIKFDASGDSKTPALFGVRGFPTIKLFLNGEYAEDYNGARNAAGIVTYALAYLGPATTVVTSNAALEEITASNDFVVVGYSAGENTPVAQTLQAAAKEMRTKLRFVLFIGNAAEANAEPESIALLAKFESGPARVVYRGELVQADLVQFLKSESLPPFGQMGPDNFQRYHELKLPIAFFFINPADATFAEYKEAFSALGEELKQEARFVWVDAEQYGGMAEQFGAPRGKFPAITMDIERKNYYLPTDAGYTVEAVRTFIRGALDGTVSRTVRSQPAPAEPTENGLTTVVGSTFDELVLNADMDVFVEFYAPWCGHCKSLEPQYALVARTLSGSTGLRIAKIDATANDFDKTLFPVEGFPTIYFYKKSKEAPIPYDGGRDAESMMDFLKSESSATFTDATVSNDEL